MMEEAVIMAYPTLRILINFVDPKSTELVPSLSKVLEVVERAFGEIRKKNQGGSIDMPSHKIMVRISVIGASNVCNNLAPTFMPPQIARAVLETRDACDEALKYNRDLEGL